MLDLLIISSQYEAAFGTQLLTKNTVGRSSSIKELLVLCLAACLKIEAGLKQILVPCVDLS